MQSWVSPGISMGTRRCCWWAGFVDRLKGIAHRVGDTDGYAAGDEDAGTAAGRLRAAVGLLASR